MKHTTWTHPLLGVLIISAVGLMGCSHSGSNSEKPRFTSLPKNCTGLSQPADPAIKQFAGKLYKADTKFTDSTAELPQAPHSPTVICFISYSDTSLPSGNETAGQAKTRSVGISYTIDTVADGPVAFASQHFKKDRDAFKGEKTTPNGIGEEAFTGIEKTGDDVRLHTGFRISNLTVDVTVGGKNFTGEPDPQTVGDSPEHVSDLKSGAESVARALADNVDTVMSTK